MTLRRKTSLRRDRSGASAVEFALVLMPLLMMAFGVIEYGRLLWTKQALQEAAIAGARCMGILANSCASGGGFNSTSTTSYIQQVAGGWGITVPSADVTLNHNATCGGETGFSQVSLAFAFTSVVPKIVLLVGSDNLTATACFPNNPPLP
ncbi:MAG TPA: TadE/TadG family type IV pilus assembly protein [Stellaceae bacterium]|nr:TadE/TadG family type IV pilus assembly protein [Stellaceae bacterium]